MLFLFMLLREKDQKVLYSFEMLLLSEKLFQKYRSAALMIQIVNIDKSEDVSVFLRVVLVAHNHTFYDRMSNKEFKNSLKNVHCTEM